MTVYFNIDPSKSSLVLTNPPDAYRRYHAVQFIANRHSSKRLDFNASYTWSRTAGNYNNAFGSNAADGDLGAMGNFVNPNREDQYGRTDAPGLHAPGESLQHVPN